jgi:hypothetical protein
MLSKDWKAWLRFDCRGSLMNMQPTAACSYVNLRSNYKNELESLSHSPFPFLEFECKNNPENSRKNK